MKTQHTFYLNPNFTDKVWNEYVNDQELHLSSERTLVFFSPRRNSIIVESSSKSEKDLQDFRRTLNRVAEFLFTTIGHMNYFLSYNTKNDIQI